MVKLKPISSLQIEKTVNGKTVRGTASEEILVSEIGEPSDVSSAGVCFIITESYLSVAKNTKASVVVVTSKLADKLLSEIPDSVRVCIACDDAYLGLANLSRYIVSQDASWDWDFWQDADSGIHPSAQVDSTAKISGSAFVGANCKIGAGTIVHPRVVLGPETIIGEDCILFPGVVTYPRTQMGNHVRLHANVVLGGDGFGYAKSQKGAVKIWHLGRVVIHDDVEIGPGTTVDRGTLRDSVIESGAKLDNLVQVGHNGYIGAHSILCAQTGLSGNVTIGRGAVLAGKAGVANKIRIGDGAVIGPMSGVSKDVGPAEVVLNTFLAKPRREWWRLLAVFDRLPEIYDRLKKVEMAVFGKSDLKKEKPPEITPEL